MAWQIEKHGHDFVQLLLSGEEPVSPCLDSALRSALTNRMWQKWFCRSSKAQASEGLEAFTVALLDHPCLHIRKPGLDNWMAKDSVWGEAQWQPAPRSLLKCQVTTAAWATQVRPEEKSPSWTQPRFLTQDSWDIMNYCWRPLSLGAAYYVAIDDR